MSQPGKKICRRLTRMRIGGTGNFYQRYNHHFHDYRKRAERARPTFPPLLPRCLARRRNWADMLPKFAGGPHNTRCIYRICASHLEHDRRLAAIGVRSLLQPWTSVIATKSSGSRIIDSTEARRQRRVRPLLFHGPPGNLATAPDSFSTTRQFPCTGGAQSGIRSYHALQAQLAQAVQPRVHST